MLLHPKAPGIPIALVEAERQVVFCDTDSVEPKDSPAGVARTWVFYVEPVSETSSRLIIRGCFEQLRKRTLKERAAFALEQPIDCVMELRMLRTIKRLAEAAEQASRASLFRSASPQ